ILTLPASSSADSWDAARRRATSGRRGFSMERAQAAASAAVPNITASPAMLEALFRGETRPADQLLAGAASGNAGPSFALSSGKQVSFTLGVKTERATTQNVVAVLEGSDSVLKSEYVAFGAHYDHVGVGAPIGGDSIYNGADDDGSGTVALLSMAE